LEDVLSVRGDACDESVDDTEVGVLLNEVDSPNVPGVEAAHEPVDGQEQLAHRNNNKQVARELPGVLEVDVKQNERQRRQDRNGSDQGVRESVVVVHVADQLVFTEYVHFFIFTGLGVNSNR
jgi:hypothetical protein